jgi:hypothetical protein
MSDIAQQFMDLFSGLTIAHGKMQLKETFKDSGKHEAYHQIVREPVTINSWIGHLNGQSIGIVPIQDDGQSCSFGAIDIDSYQGFSFVTLQTRINNLGLPLVVCRSKSGGAHCYLFLKKALPAEIVYSTLREWSAALGFATNTKGEPTEIFPKQVKLLLENNDVGSFINMPYAGGANTQRYAYKLEGDELKELSPEEFIEYANSKKVSLQQLKDISIPVSDEFFDGPPCLAMLAKISVDEGGRNTALHGMGVYYKNKFPDSWEDKVEHANRTFLTIPLSSKEVTNVIRSVGKKDYGYPCKQSPLVNYCIKSVCITRKYGVGSDLGESPVLDTITKINSDPPTYIINLVDRSGRPIPIHVTVEELLSSRKMKQRCLQALDYLPFIPKQADWEKQVQTVMERLSIVEVPQDSSSSGQLIQHLQTYLAKKARTGQRSELLNGRPFYEDDKVYFRLFDFCTYLEQNHFRTFKPHEITAIFRREQESGNMGHKQFNIDGRCTQTWWTHRQKEVELQIPETLKEDDVY